MEWKSQGRVHHLVLSHSTLVEKDKVDVTADIIATANFEDAFVKLCKHALRILKNS